VYFGDRCARASQGVRFRLLLVNSPDKEIYWDSFAPGLHAQSVDNLTGEMELLRLLDQWLLMRLVFCGRGL